MAQLSQFDMKFHYERNDNAECFEKTKPVQKT